MQEVNNNIDTKIDAHAKFDTYFETNTISDIINDPKR